MGLACSLTTLALVGLAASPVMAEPAVLYIPTEDVALTPTNSNGCTSQENSALGCTAAVDVEEVVSPYANALALRDELAAALVPYDVHLATERPPDYLAYTMLLPSDTPDPASMSFTCSRAGIRCGARKRNSIIAVYGPTSNCPTLDVPLASIHAFGRASGLEGVADPLDAMHYVPDFAMASGTFVDGCSTVVNQIGFDAGGMQISLPRACTSLDHVGCGSDDQNGHADLLDYYGPRVIDMDPPVLSNPLPGNGAVIRELGELVLDVDISDADPVVGGRWTVSAPVLEDAGFEGGVLTYCTNDACDYGWDDANPLKPTGSDWELVLAGLPADVYEITFDAADFHGNVATPLVMVVYVGEGPPGLDFGGFDSGSFDSGSFDSGALDADAEDSGSLDSNGTFTTGASGPPSSSGMGEGPPLDEDSSTSGPGADDGLLPHGCVCTATRSSRGGDWGWGLLVGLALVRRRRPTARA